MRAFGGRGERGGRGFEFGRGRGHRLDDLADGGLEVVGEPDHVGLALSRGDLILLALGLRFRAGLFLGLDLEGLDCLRHVADLVLALEPGEHHAEIAAGELLHARG